MDSSSQGSAGPAQPAVHGPARAAFVEGKDYTVVERWRFLDRERFDQPVEAFSMLFPRGWRVDGGVRWLGIQNCRADIVSNYIKAASPDGAIQYEVRPSRSFVWANDPMMMRVMQAGARSGGCEMNQPFDAAQYIEGYARRDLGATASEIKPDTERLAQMQQVDAQANAVARQYGNDTQQATTIAFGRLAWPNGDEGILHVGVTNNMLRKRDVFGGGVSVQSSTSVFFCVMMRFPAARREEATRLFGMIQSSYRQNPIWKQAKEQFLTALGNAEHASRMETIRLMGEQARAYARAQSDASARQMRDWEAQQASQDQQHKEFIQTIREVETWKDANGTVELSSGYNQAWSRGDGSYILSNSPTFDPGTVFQDQRWQEMARTRPQ